MFYIVYIIHILNILSLIYIVLNKHVVIKQYAIIYFTI